MSSSPSGMPRTTNPALTDYTASARAVIKKMARSESGIELIVQGIERVTLLKEEQTQPFLKARTRPLPMPEDTGTELEALQRAVVELAARAIQLMQVETPVNLQQLILQAGDPLRLAYMLGSMLSLEVAKEQALLEAPTRLEALRLLHGYLTHEVQVLELRQKINNQAESQMTKQQREFVLRQQLQAIQEELGEKNPEKAEVEELHVAGSKRPSCPRQSRRRRIANCRAWSECRPRRRTSR